MAALKANTLRPGLLVSLKTSVTGNVKYARKDLEGGTLAGGAVMARWETERVIVDPVEHESARKAQAKASSLIRSVCVFSAFGLLCPESKADELEAAVIEARAVTTEFNATATLSRVSVYVITGRVAPDDVEAVKAISSEVRDLLEAMETGLKNLDVKAVRDAAGRAKSIGNMLSPAAQERITVAIEAARTSARKLVQAGEQVAQQIDLETIKKITEQRLSFLDLDDQRDVAAPEHAGLALDLAPEGETIKPAAPKQSTLEIE